MENINRIIHDFYSQESYDTSLVYENARFLSYMDEGVYKESLKKIVKNRKVKDMNVVRIDMISDDLAYAQVTFKDKDKVYNEIVGAIRVKEKWIIVCLLSSSQNLRFENLYSNNLNQQAIELNKINQLLLRYCHDVYIMDVEDCLDMFWSQAHMYHPNNDGETFTDVGIQVLNERWKDTPNPKELGISEFSRIFHVEMLNNVTVIAKIGCAKLKDHFYDYLFLIKVNKEWKIVNKMTQMLHSGERI